MERSTEETVLDYVRRFARKKDVEIDFDTRLEDIEIESIEFLELVFDLEEELDIEIDYNANEDQQILTVRQLCDKVAEMVAKHRNGASSSE